MVQAYTGCGRCPCAASCSRWSMTPRVESMMQIAVAPASAEYIVGNRVLSGLPKQKRFRVRHLRTRFDASLAVKGLSFSNFGRNYRRSLGPNGAGKSTTLRMICGEYTSRSHGEVSRALPHFDERTRRLMVASEAKASGYRGVRMVSPAAVCHEKRSARGSRWKPFVVGSFDLGCVRVKSALSKAP